MPVFDRASFIQSPRMEEAAFKRDPLQKSVRRQRPLEFFHRHRDPRATVRSFQRA